MYLAMSDAAKEWTMPIKDWGAALNQFALFFGGGFRSYEFYLHKTIDRALNPPYFLANFE
jgi:hypothetical protein